MKSKKICVTLSDETYDMVRLKAIKERKSISCIVKDFVNDGVERDEDIYCLNIIKKTETEINEKNSVPVEYGCN